MPAGSTQSMSPGSVVMPGAGVMPGAVVLVSSLNEKVKINGHVSCFGSPVYVFYFYLSILLRLWISSGYLSSCSNSSCPSCVFGIFSQLSR